jgi:S-adenosylmethionine:tRNA ribosyltransferase-isomerase
MRNAECNPPCATLLGALGSRVYYSHSAFHIPHSEITLSDFVSDYDYHLPPELIAQQPLPQRSDARLMVIDRSRQSIEHHHVRDLPSLLTPGDCVVLNDTRVVPARLVGFRTRTGGRWQGLYLQHDTAGHWQILGKTRGKMEVGETITLMDQQGLDGVRLKLLARQADGVLVVQPLSHDTAYEILEEHGRTPLPHYIREGEMEPADIERYQTVFAVNPGSVAAPTAGLHFTPALLTALEANGVKTARVTLHVGIGTFRPIATERLSEHVMHREWATITPAAVATIQTAKASGGRCIAVGTTSMRTLESASRSGALAPFIGETDLFIRPGFAFHTVDGLLTNFHLPKSTLLVLVRTFGGEELLRRAYEIAIQERYRFFSYGDAMLIV